MNYTIENFWKPLLMKAVKSTSHPLIQGWQFIHKGPDAFVEAPLTQNTSLIGNVNPSRCPILLVSAPGAVGKTTLARQIAYVTKSVYIDLAESEPVGGNTLTGGLVNSGLYSNWTNQTTTVLVDGIDEARLRITGEGFEAFLSDIIRQSNGRGLPTVLFGRTGAIEDAWLVLDQQGIASSVLEIGYFDSDRAVEFAVTRLHSFRAKRPHIHVEKKAIGLLLQELRKQTEHDGDRFAGYAPVLQAVADHVNSHNNPGELVARLEAGEQPVSLTRVAFSILKREHNKVNNISFEDVSLADRLYSPSEQLDHLVGQLYGVSLQSNIPDMGAGDARTYGDALKEWVPEHPFLSGNFASSAVFDAVICAHALGDPASAKVALQKELSRGHAANPFLAEFYPIHSGDPDDSKVWFLPSEHIGIVYASLRAQLSIGDTANLLVEGKEDNEDEESLRSEIEISLTRYDSEQSRTLHFESDQTGIIHLGIYIEDVEMTVPYADVEIGPEPEAVLIAPVTIQCSNLAITSGRIIVDAPSNPQMASVFLEAESLQESAIVSVPAVRPNVDFSVSWSNAQVYPWASFAVETSSIDDSDIDEALRRFRKFVIAFRSYGRGRLGRYKGKIEHSRMTKGVGQKILDAMIAEDIISLEGRMYFLDPDRLSEKTGADYMKCVKRSFGPNVISFVRHALN